MRVFLSYPMNGRTKEECLKTREMLLNHFPLYREWEWVDNLDCEVEDGSNPLYYLGEALKKLSTCDAIMIAPGSIFARGCRIELRAAKEYGLKIIDGFDENHFEFSDFIGCDRIRNKLRRGGVHTLWSLYNTPIEEIAHYNGVGEKTLKIIADKKKELEDVMK